MKSDIERKRDCYIRIHIYIYIVQGIEKDIQGNIDKNQKE